MKTKVRLNIHLKLWLNGRIGLNSSFRIKDRVLHAIQVEMWNKAYLRVSYGNEKFNDGYYYNLPDIKRALSVFTEKPLTEYLRK